MTQRSLCCNNASLSPSTSVYDIRKEIFEPGYIEAIDDTLDHNLHKWEDTCPLGYIQRGDRCIFINVPQPTWHRGYDIWKERVLKKLNECGESPESGLPKSMKRTHIKKR